MYRVKIDDGRPGAEYWEDFEREWDALQYAKDASRHGYLGEVWYNGRMEVAYHPHGNHTY